MFSKIRLVYSRFIKTKSTNFQEMISRLIFASLRQNLQPLPISQNQNRNFRRLASTTSNSGSSTSISNLQIISPGVNIKPKRAPNAYNLFVQEKFKELHLKNPKIGESSKIIAQQWKSLSDKEKKNYEDESTKIQKAYEDAFVRMSSEEFRQAVLDEMKRLQSKRVRQLRRQQKELKEEHQYPKADRDYFCAQAMAKDRQDEIPSLEGKGRNGLASRVRKIGELWQNLSPEDKEIYQKRQSTARSRYKKQIEAWEKQMQKRGLASVVDKINLRRQEKLQTSIRRRSATTGKIKVLASKIAVAKRRPKKDVGEGTTTRKRKSTKKEAKKEEEED